MKIFNNSQLTIEQLRQLICKAAKKFGVNRVIFNSRGKYILGSYNAFNKNLYLDTKQTKPEMLNVFFHELGHHFAVKRNRWNKYHFNLVPTINVDQMFDIENKIDKSASSLWYKYVDTKKWGKYKYIYLKTKRKIITNSLLRTN